MITRGYDGVTRYRVHIGTLVHVASKRISELLIALNFYTSIQQNEKKNTHLRVVGLHRRCEKWLRDAVWVVAVEQTEIELSQPVAMLH